VRFRAEPLLTPPQVAASMAERLITVQGQNTVGE
jgi:hypothetical protein